MGLLLRGSLDTGVQRRFNMPFSSVEFIDGR